MLVSSTIVVDTAQAGWEGPAKFWKSRQRANAAKLLAPFEVSLARLKDVRTSLQGSSPNYLTALASVRRASCNCYEFEAMSMDSIETKASLVTQQLKLADPCTFRILVKNTTLLMSPQDPLRLEAEHELEKLIRNYNRLDGALMQAGEWDSETKHQVVPLLDECIATQEGLKDLVAQAIAQD